jgi:adenylate cyclase
MVEKGLQRKLRAIFSADVKGYSKLMGDDDEYTVNTLTKYLQIIAALIEKHEGRVVDSPGDNLLAEFGSSLNAARGAIEIQRILERENGKRPENRRMDFRIDINLGDIIHKDDRIYGDGVNVAARIESLADPGGIAISRGVYEQIEGRLEAGFADLGAHTVKNIKKPVNVYKVLLDPKEEAQVIDGPRVNPPIRRWVVAAIIGLLTAVGGFAIWFNQEKPEYEPASVDRMAFPLGRIAKQMPYLFAHWRLVRQSAGR